MADFSIDKNDLVALEALIQRLLETKVFPAAEAAALNESRMRGIVEKMVADGLTYGAASGGLSFLQEADALDQIRSFNDDLGRQVQIIQQMLDSWFEWGETVYPYYPLRVAIILRKAKAFEDERRFLAAFGKHFRGKGASPYEKLTTRAEKLGLNFTADGP